MTRDERDRPSTRPTLRSLVGFLCLAAAIALGLAPPRTSAIAASAEGGDETQENAAVLHTVSVSLGGTELSLSLLDDGVVDVTGSGAVGTWIADAEGDDTTITSGSSSWTLVGFCLAGEGESGALQSGDGDGTAGDTWTLLEIHPVEVGNLLYNLEFVDDVIFLGTFTSETIDGVVHDVSVGTGNTLEIVSPHGTDVISLSDGCHVFITGGDTGALAIQDPQGKPQERRPPAPARRVLVTPPKGYAPGKWKIVTEPVPAKNCFAGNPVQAGGRSCSLAAGDCMLVVIYENGAGRLVRDLHAGACGVATNTYQILGSGSLWVGF